MLNVHQWIDERSHTRTYAVVDSVTSQAVVIDAVRDRHPQTVEALRALNVEVTALLETHVHADHITGAALLKDALSLAQTAAPVIVVSARAQVHGDVQRVVDGDRIKVGDHALTVRSTPGHTEGCISFVLDGAFVAHDGAAHSGAVFCGDALLIGGCGRTDFQGGDAATLFHAVRNKLFTLPENTVVYPAHDYRGRTHSFIREERRTNARLKDGTSLDTFVALMAALSLPEPAQIALAVPANETAGHVGAEWDPAAFEANADGILEVKSGFVDLETGLAPPGIVLLDTRPSAERERDGQLATAIPISFDSLETLATTWSKEMPAVTICRRGIRSLDAAQRLMNMGFQRVASLKGGMELFAANATRWESIRVLAQDAAPDVGDSIDDTDASTRD